MALYNSLLNQCYKIPENGFSIYLTKIVLAKNNNQITGTGHLYQKDGKFIMELMNADPPSEVEQTFNLFSDDVLLKNKYTFASNRKEFQQVVLRSLIDEAGDWKNIWEIKTETLTVKLHERRPYLLLELFSNTSVKDDDLKKVLDTLNFVMGEEHNQYYAIYFGEQNSFEVVIPVDHKFSAHTMLTEPCRKSTYYGDEDEHNATLFNSYYNYLVLNPETLLPKIHKRVMDAGTGYYFRYGLVLSVAIESLLVKLYPKNPEPIDEVVLSDIDFLRKELRNLKTEDIKLRLTNFLNGLTDTSKYNPGRMLKQLEQLGVIGKGSLKSWQKLRHTYAHGADYNDDLSVAINLVQHNLTLYYELIFNVIGYTGRYASYSVENRNEFKNYPLN